MNFKEMIRTYIKALRDCRADRETPMLLGCGFTVACQGSTNAYYSVREKEYNMSARWNTATCWTQSGAYRMMEYLRKTRPELGPLEVIHRNDLRDRDEAAACQLLKHLLPHRHKVIA